ncbi:hypothetical protein, partial [Halomonas sp. 3D7M]|uniref:hypothetical protein n=1 Tax=Halomonas sp. 3D7M TaxID=2742617 RepID=UPI001D013597
PEATIRCIRHEELLKNLNVYTIKINKRFLVNTVSREMSASGKVKNDCFYIFVIKSIFYYFFGKADNLFG